MVTVEVIVDDELSDRRQRRTGLRQVSWDDWVCSVNGERLFLKGANLLPTSSNLADAHPVTSCATTSSRRSTSASTWCASTATSRTATRTPRPTNSASCCSRTFPLQWRYARSRSRPGGRTGAGAGRLARAPPVDRVVVGPRRPDAELDATTDTQPGFGRGERPLPAAIVRRPAAADVEQVGARPLGEALVRASRSDPDDRGPLRRRPAPAPARRNRQPPVVRLAARRSGRPRRLRPPDAEHGAIRQRVRRRFGALDASVLRRRTRRRRVARHRLGSARRRERLRHRHVRAALPAEFVRLVRRVAEHDAVLPIARAQGADRDAAHAQVPPDGRLLLLEPRRPCADWCRRACSTTNGSPRTRTRSCAPHALPCSSSSSRCPTG